MVDHGYQAIQAPAEQITSCIFQQLQDHDIETLQYNGASSSTSLPGVNNQNFLALMDVKDAENQPVTGPESPPWTWPPNMSTRNLTNLSGVIKALRTVYRFGNIDPRSGLTDMSEEVAIQQIVFALCLDTGIPFPRFID